jgi:hypothetical protein
MSSALRPTPNLEDRVPVDLSPRKSVAQLYPPGTGFPFHRLLRLAGLRWGYSNPPPLWGENSDNSYENMRTEIIRKVWNMKEIRDKRNVLIPWELNCG